MNDLPKRISLGPNIDNYVFLCYIDVAISRFDISASAIGFDLNTRLLRPGLVESTCRAPMRSESLPLSVYEVLVA